MIDNSKELVIKEKCEKDFPDFTSAVAGLSLDQLKENLSTYANYREETELAKKKDEALQNAKEVAKELNGPYADTLKALKTKTAYLHVLMAEKKELNGEEKENQQAAV